VLTKLAYALYGNTIKKPKDLERQDLPGPSARSISSVLAANASSQALRNFSLPRERCLDASPMVSARPLPVPPPYVATGLSCTAQNKPRPLPALPSKVPNTQTALSDPQIIDEVVIQPLKIRKISSMRSSLTLEKPPQPEPSIIKPLEEPR
jgi:hypothetical protein